jgi:cytochrome c oxidase cbb3-type subunit 3
VSRPVAALLAAVMLVACDRMPGRPREADRPLRPSQVTDFARLWGENCAGCHGAGGALGPAAPMANPVYLAWVDDDTLRRVTAEGVPGTAMPAFARRAGGSLTDEQVEIVVRGMRARWGRPLAAAASLPPYAGGPGDPARGAAEYHRRCAACHDPGGDGEPHGGSVTGPAYLALVSDQALRTATVAGRPDLGMPDWRGPRADAPMSAQDVTDVVAWVASHRGGGG